MSRRLAKWAEAAVAAVMVITFVYGILRFPDAPLHACATGYCGKQGQLHSFADFQAFDFWQAALFVIWPIGMMILLLLTPWRKS